MKYLFKLLSIIILIIFVSGCEEEELTGDPNYPTLLQALNDQELDTRFDQLENTPIYGCTLLDDFGFFALNLKDTKLCSIEDSVESCFSVEQLDSIGKSAALKYASFTGVEDSSLMKLQAVSTYNTSKVFSYEKFRATYPDSFPPAWRLVYSPQVVNGMQVRGTSLYMIVGASEVLAIGGNWFNDIYQPAADQFDEAKAKETLYNVKLIYDDKYIKPNEDTEWRTSNRVIVPVTRSKQIELRICWALYTGSWEIIVDTQTGERLSAIDLNAL